VALLRGCFSFGSAGRRRPKASPLPSPPRLTASAAAAAAAADDGAKMKGLFKSKPRTPVDVVRQTRENLVHLDLNSGSRGGDAKREEKVRSNLSPCRGLSWLRFPVSARGFGRGSCLLSLRSIIPMHPANFVVVGNGAGKPEARAVMILRLFAFALQFLVCSTSALVYLILFMVKLYQV
jgi:hypothetical protein